MDDGEDSLVAAAREVEEERGWHPHGHEFVLSCQPLIGNADYAQDLFLARRAELVGEPDADETAEVRWVPLEETPEMIARGDILGAITIIGVQRALHRGQSLAIAVRLPRGNKPSQSHNSSSRADCALRVSRQHPLPS